MSRGPGKVERAIEAAFLASPDATFSVAELGAIVYPGLNRIEKRHRVAILRAAEKVSQRLWWRGSASERPGGPVIYFNLLNVRSYTLGKMRTHYLNGAEPLDRVATFLEPPEWGDPWRRRNQWDEMQPGGAWWIHVEMAKAQKAGDLAAYEKLRVDLRASVARKYGVPND